LNRWKNYFCQLLNVHDIMILGRHICIWVVLRFKLLLKR
jgi:hypothetical protein